MRAHHLIVVGLPVGCAGDVAHGPSTSALVTEASSTTVGATTAEASTTGAETLDTTTGEVPTTGMADASTGRFVLRPWPEFLLQNS